jgi:hypothetical protein
MAECFRRGRIGDTLPGGLVPALLERGIEVHYASFGFLIFAAMMISKTLRIPKF